jgi:uncharacterized protein YdaL
MADNFTKQLGTTLFHRHVDYIMGHVPPHYTVHFQKLLGLSQIANFTKQLGTTLFHRHVDYIMRPVPPHYTVHFQKLLGLSQIAPPNQVLHPTLAVKLCQLWIRTTRHHTSILSNPILA